MGKFKVIPQDTFDGLQMDAGVLLKTFDPSNPVAPADEDIICATTGGINVVCTPTFSDFGEDIDNVPNNMKELKHLDSWDCSLSTSSLGTTPALIKMALGCADISESDSTQVIPRADLSQSDFTDLWWVGDKANGGLVAVQLKNALSTGGFSLQTTKNGKGTIAITITGHVSITNQSEVPMVFYSADPETPVTTYTVTQTLSHATSSFSGETVNEHASFEATLTANDDYSLTAEGASVTVTLGGVDVTSTAWDSATTKVTIADATGAIVVTATAVYTGA